MKKKVAIIGRGAWGKAMHHVISQNTSSVRLVGRGEMITEEIIVIAVPTNNIHELEGVIRSESKRPVIINTSKGIEEKEHRLPSEVIHELLPRCRYYTLIGPGFSREVVANFPTLVNLGYSADKKAAREVAALFSTDTFRVHLTRSVHILELSAALKNVYAIGCGLADGLGYEMNTRTFLCALAIEEMQRYFHRMKLRNTSDTVVGTMGDLILTCNSAESRNYSFGRFIAEGSVAEAIKRSKGIVEGYTTIEALPFLEYTGGGYLPLASFIRGVITNDAPKSVKKKFNEFIKAI